MSQLIKDLKNLNINVINMNGKVPFEIKDDDILIYDKTFFIDILFKGDLGVGEAYMKKKWDCKRLDLLYYKIISSRIHDKYNNKSLEYIYYYLHNILFNKQNKKLSYQVEDIHYNISNILYENMLGTSMAYSCGYWKKESDTLDDAQNNKFELLCKKLKLKNTDHVLDIGCGFGGLMKYISDNYGCKVDGINLSSEQIKYAKNLCKNNENIKFYECDYRDINKYIHNYKYDKIVSVGFFEHVGHKNYKTLMKITNSLLKDNGIFLLHTIGTNNSVHDNTWINKYIFPGGYLPSFHEISEASDDIFVIEDVQNIGSDYEKTLIAWYNNYENSIKNNIIQVEESFNRMWKYYLLMCAASFKCKYISLWQIVFTKNYHSKYERET